MNWLRRLFGLETKPPKPCTCDGCTGREPNRSKSRYVSHGVSFWIGADGEMHYRYKSRIVG